MALGPVNSFLMPDISGDGTTSPAILAAARAAADSMGGGEVLLRAAAEIGGTWLLAWAIKAAIARLGAAALRNAREGLDGTTVDSSGNIPKKQVSRLVIESGLSAVAAPARLLVPLAAGAHTLRIVSLAAQILADGQHWRGVLTAHRLGGHAAMQFLGMLQRLDVSMLDLSQIAVVVFLTWFLFAWKESLTDIVLSLEKRKRDLGQETGGLERVLLPMSSLAGWGLVAAGALMALHVMGLNIQPLLTVGGVGGLAIGFGAQAVTSNAISGLNLFLTRPFVVGDRIEVKTTGGGTVLVGTVEKIDVMRTVVRTDKGVPVSVPNRSITDMIVCNESRLGTSAVVRNFANARQFSTSIGVRYEDLPKVKDIVADIQAFLDTHPGVDRRLPLGASLGSVRDKSIQIGLVAHTTPAQSSNFGAFTDEVTWKLVDIVKKHAADFA